MDQIVRFGTYAICIDDDAAFWYNGTQSQYSEKSLWPFSLRVAHMFQEAPAATPAARLLIISGQIFVVNERVNFFLLKSGAEMFIIHIKDDERFRSYRAECLLYLVNVICFLSIFFNLLHKNLSFLLQFYTHKYNILGYITGEDNGLYQQKKRTRFSRREMARTKSSIHCSLGKEKGWKNGTRQAIYEG